MKTSFCVLNFTFYAAREPVHERCFHYTKKAIHNLSQSDSRFSGGFGRARRLTEPIEKNRRKKKFRGSQKCEPRMVMDNFDEKF